jgi:trigger factor
VDRAVDAMLRGALRSLAQRGVDPRMLSLDFDKLREEMRDRAAQEVKGALILEAIADREDLKATDEDLEQRLTQLAEEQGTALANVKKQFKTPEAKESLTHRVREEKTIAFLKGQASNP